MNIEKEEQLFKKRMTELERLAEKRYCPVYSDFLNMNEISMLLSMNQELSRIPLTLFGGYEEAERKIACFHGGEPDGEDRMRTDFPITCLRIRPVNAKFSDALTHRDYLGAVLNLGIERGKTGDIIIREDAAFLFCCRGIAPFIRENLIQVKHTAVRAEEGDFEQSDIHPEYREIKGTVSSVRLDSLISLAFGISRGGSADYIDAGKVFVNGRISLSGSRPLKEGDVISVRGLGRFIFSASGGVSRKGRLGVTLSKYI
ncbi:MAG TPA: RNA-binding protein [Candidatus Caccomorpha excrementavium]|nr:RNA-binding protein [Candidatus Caccomorpha excrementavium]